MKNIDYDSILSGFQRKRLENEILADNRKAEIYEKIPEIKKIDQEIASSSIQAARNRIRKLPVNMEDINQNNRELAAYKKALLKEMDIRRTIWNQSMNVRSVTTPAIREAIPANV